MSRGAEPEHGVPGPIPAAAAAGRSRRSATWWAVLVVLLAIDVGLVAYGATSNPGERLNVDALDLVAGRPDPDESPLEDHLDWALAVLDGADFTDDDLRDRFTDGFLAEVPPSEVRAVMSQGQVMGPYDFHGFATVPFLGASESAQVALRLKSGLPVALTATTDQETGTRLDGIFVQFVPPDQVPYGSFGSGELGLGIGAGLGLAAMGLVLIALGRHRVALMVTAGSALWLGHLLEQSNSALLYTAALVAPVAAVVLVAAAVATSLGSTRPALVAGLGTGAAAAILPLTAIDTAALSLPRNLLAIGAGRDTTQLLLVISGIGTAVAAVWFALYCAQGLIRQGPSDPSQKSRWVGAETPTAGAGIIASGVLAIPAASLVFSRDGFDLSPSPTTPIALLVAAAGLVAWAAWRQADVAAELDRVRRSRARIVEAEEQARRQVERDLHDGAQQRLLALQLAMRGGQRRLAGRDPEFDNFLDSMVEELSGAVVELRELARGLYPAVLDQGLGPALTSLAETSPLPMTVSGTPGRCQPATEQAVYFVVREAMTNAVRHADADHVQVELARADGWLICRFVDDGDGGAQPGSGSGLQNIEDRVLALGGSWSLTSEPGAGTTIEVQVPCG